MDMGSLWDCPAFDAASSLEDAEELKAEEVGALAGNANEIGCAALTDVELFLVFQRDHSAAVAAKGRDALQISIRRGHRHDRAVAVNGVPRGGEVPASAFRVLRQL
jgi:hypothetical protein